MLFALAAAHAVSCASPSWQWVDGPPGLPDCAEGLLLDLFEELLKRWTLKMGCPSLKLTRPGARQISQNSTWKSTRLLCWAPEFDRKSLQLWSTVLCPLGGHGQHDTWPSKRDSPVVLPGSAKMAYIFSGGQPPLLGSADSRRCDPSLFRGGGGSN